MQSNAVQPSAPLAAPHASLTGAACASVTTQHGSDSASHMIRDSASWRHLPDDAPVRRSPGDGRAGGAGARRRASTSARCSAPRATADRHRPPRPPPPRLRRAAPEWSGESGASGHPLMTAQAIRAAAANFRSCLEGLWPQAERRGVSRAVFDANVAGLTPDLRIMDLLDSQPEFTKSFWDYLDILVSDDAHRQRPRHPGAAPRGVRRGREGLRRRPPYHRRDLGRRSPTTAR